MNTFADSGIASSGMEEIAISVGENCRDNAPKSHTVTPAKLFKRLQQRRFGPKDGKYFQLVSYTSGAHRDKEHVDQIFGYVADIDSGGYTRKDIEDTFGGFSGFAYTTHSSTPDNPKWRVLLVFSQPVSGPVFEAIDAHWRESFGDCLDVRSAEPAQLWYLPSAASQDDVHEAFEIDGARFDVTPFFELASPPKSENRGNSEGNGDDHPDGPLFAALNRGGHVIKREHRDGTWLIECPWADEHTVEPDNPSWRHAYYYESHHGGFRGEGLKCFHDCCKARGASDVPGLRSGKEQEHQRKLIEDLAALPPMEYDRRREKEAEAFGCRVGTLDASVKQARGKDDSGAKGTSITFESIEPWPEDVDGAAVMREIEDAIQQHVILPSESYATAIALWILTTYLIEYIRVAPRLLIKSPTKRCGKSTLMEIISHLCHRALPASNISPAAVFRTIDMHAPVLLIDEADSFLKENEELRGVVNSGHSRRLAFVIRIVGDDHDPRKFNTFAMMAIAGIKDQAETIEDRSIIVSLRRRCPGEPFTKLRNPRPLSVLSRKLAKLSSQIKGAVHQAEPDDVKGMDDRATDNWEPLFAAADAIGGEWPERARNAAKALIDGEAPEGLGIRLLRDIRAVFEGDRIYSVDLVEKLRSIEDGPWAEKDLTQNKLAFLLKPYKVKPKTLRVGETRRKGYERTVFEDEWNRYVPLDPPDTPFQTVTPLQRTNHAGSSGFQGVTKKDSVTVQEPLKATNHAGCHVVTVQNPGNGEEARSEAEIEEARREREAIQAEDATEAEAGQVPDDLTEGVV